MTLKIVVIVTVYPEMAGGADTFRLIGVGSLTTFCTLGTLTLAAITLCKPSLLLFLDVIYSQTLTLLVQ